MPVENTERPALSPGSAGLLGLTQANSDTQLQFVGSNRFLNLLFLICKSKVQVFMSLITSSTTPKASN